MRTSFSQLEEFIGTMWCVPSIRIRQFGSPFLHFTQSLGRSIGDRICKMKRTRPLFLTLHLIRPKQDQSWMILLILYGFSPICPLDSFWMTNRIFKFLVRCFATCLVVYFRHLEPLLHTLSINQSSCVFLSLSSETQVIFVPKVQCFISVPVIFRKKGRSCQSKRGSVLNEESAHYLFISPKKVLPAAYLYEWMNNSAHCLFW